ncbi:hypothetical protein DB346_14720 [Verrucomicrobia bacterium LW23]|nr:hypothetical protein DB346_14720 [Verrucomicrobia bacterium LW23]
MRRLAWICIGAVFLGCVALAYAIPHRYPVPTDVALILAGKCDVPVTLRAIEHIHETNKGMPALHGYAEVGKVELSAPAASVALSKGVSAVNPEERGLRLTRGGKLCAFDPHHAVSFTRSGHSYDVIICFSCGELLVYRDGWRLSGVWDFTGHPHNLNHALAESTRVLNPL